MIASAHPNYPPYHWQDGERIVGASVDLNTLVFSELGVEFVPVFAGPWKRVLKSAENGTLDFVMSLKQTEERDAYLTFTKYPAFPNPFTAFTLKDAGVDVRHWGDLSPLRGSKNAGDRYGQPLDDYVEKILKLPDNDAFEDNVNRLLMGRLDYILQGRYVGQAQFGVIGSSEPIVPLSNNLIEAYVHSGFVMSSPCAEHFDYVNARYLELIGDGTAERLLDENLQKWVASQTSKQMKAGVFRKHN
ncbi:substrate-binding periplasmic protein [Roseibium sp.]|uniref:substrate-binding periplasmic protein n=1 Tax=Roseibium sp. TaxID=1936156 RepID=UPI003B5008FD